MVLDKHGLAMVVCCIVWCAGRHVLDGLMSKFNDCVDGLPLL